MPLSIAIVILNWNGKKLLKQFLPTVIAHSKVAHIYIADNASTDNSINYVKTHFPEVSIIKNATNQGYAQGYNSALKTVTEDIFCLLNSDIEVTKNWLTPILKRFKSQPDVGIIQPKILDFKKKTHFEYAGAAGGFIDTFGYPFCRGRIFNSIEKDNQQYNTSTPIFWASGACFFIKRSVFNSLHGFDSHFFAHMEEIDLCWRAFNKNINCFYENESIVYHVGGATLSAIHPKKTYLNFRNSLFCLVKNAGGNLFTLILIRLLLDGLAGVKFVFEGKPEHCFSIIKSHISFYKHLPFLLKQRKSLLQKKNYAFCQSIVWAFFIKKKHYFTDLITKY